VLEATGGKAFDAICVFQLLEHLSDPIAFIKDVLNLISRNGILIIGVPDNAGPVRHFSDALTDIPPHHVSRWCESAFRIGMQGCGLRIKRVAYEPLPEYLWDYYLPVMLEKDLLPEKLGKIFSHCGLTHLLIRVLRCLRVRWLPKIAGHTLYVVMESNKDVSSWSE
jgi:hypothetical protein